MILPIVLSPVGTKDRVCWACDNAKGCGEYVLKSQRSRNDRNPIVESKGVCREIESEGSWRQTFGVTNRNLIKGLSLWVTDPWIKKPESHSEREGGKSGTRDGKHGYLPQEIWQAYLRRRYARVSEQGKGSEVSSERSTEAWSIGKAQIY
jgi:hypothetical protein